MKFYQAGVILTVLTYSVLLTATDSVNSGCPPGSNYKNWGICHSRPADSHTHATQAWNITMGRSAIVVAIIDTGVDFNHPDLRRFALGTKHWDAITMKSESKDYNGHGTHVAGIIAGSQNPYYGSAGIAPNITLMSIRYYQESASDNLKHSVEALNYAIDNGATIINYSGGGPEFSESEYLALKRAEEKGILIVAAAGNERSNLDLVDNYYYPASYRMPNIISVGAIDINGEWLRSANYSSTKVDVAAPGENIYSTFPMTNDYRPRYGVMSGTSQATAFVTGVAALILSKNPSLKPAEVKRILIESCDKLPGLDKKDKCGGKINAYRALVLTPSP